MLENQLSIKHLTTAANTPKAGLTLPTQATFNDGRSTFKKKHLTTDASPPLKLA